jgi:hypothetical protein
MRLIDNKGDNISHGKLNRIYWKEYKPWKSNNNIWFEQDIDMRILTTSDNLTYGIYHEIKI